MLIYNNENKKLFKTNKIVDFLEYEKLKEFAFKICYWKNFKQQERNDFIVY